MKKILFFLVLLSAVNLRFAFAEESFEASKVLSEDQSTPTPEETMPPQDTKPKLPVVPESSVKEEKPAAAESSSPALVNLDMSRATARVADLERRVEDLEQEKRFQDDRIRGLERTVDDLRRSR